jgi:DNA-binding winged helix-turn-helix (wHTH) protein
MSPTLRLPDGSYMRHTDVQRILSDLYAMRCVEMTGFSNLGKSSLMRLLAQPDVWLRELGESSSDFLPVYIDCNRMLEMTDQGFYELVLRCLQESSAILAEDRELVSAYETLIAPSSEFQVPLSFSRGLTAALGACRAKMVLLFDEFDEPFQQIDSRVFLNLRAKKDRHGSTLVYMTATVRSLSDLRPGDHCSEFCELFIHQPWRLAPLTFSDVEKYVQSYASQNTVDFVQADADFIFLWTGGHPGMVDSVCHLLTDALRNEETEIRDRRALQRMLIPSLHRDPTLRDESDKIWQKLEAEEQVALISLISSKPADPAMLDRLRQRHLLIEVEGELSTFSRLFTHYLQQKQTMVNERVERLWVDTDSGEVLVNGKAVDTLTRLEYQLMRLLFENTEKIVDKYQIVSGVWGDDYIDEVDDARIEKLVSRLRQKVEPDPSTPRFVTTVRGRGYRLILT